ncbi:MAG: hypothetical protein IJR27_04850 [Synergistaceae bacterium]|nr:hypothetical protein [Synergistaceae bacterium]
MTKGIYTLEFPRQSLVINSSTNTNSPAVVLVSALSYALAVSISTSIAALFTASLMPLTFILTKRFKLSHLVKINIVNIIMIFTLAMTWPIFIDGLVMGAVIALRVNMICVAFGVMIYPLGTAGMYEALCVLNVPMKLRVLVILTLRGIYTLSERYSSSITSVKLRAPELSGMMRLKVFAYMIGNILLQTSERSENIMRAVKCRGGFGGFKQSENDGFNLRDIVMMTGYAFYVLGIVLLNNA